MHHRLKLRLLASLPLIVLLLLPIAHFGAASAESACLIPWASLAAAAARR